MTGGASNPPDDDERTIALRLLEVFPEVQPVAMALLDGPGRALWAETERFWYGASPRP